MGLDKARTRWRNQGHEPPDELKRGERHSGGAIGPKTLECHPDEAGRCLLQPGASESRTSQIPTQALAAFSVPTADRHSALQDVAAPRRAPRRGVPKWDVSGLLGVGSKPQINSLKDWLL